ncbi:MAG TPA: hypothetical protein VFB08_02155 [Burkholderiales bacterium]|nr:hypothetical protein [Burkholderiales bacterium]
MFPLAIIAGSMLLNYMNNAEAQSRRNSLQQAMQAYQQSKARQNEQAINNLVSQQTPQKRADELNSITASRAASMQNTVDQVRSAAPISTTAGTNTSPDYQKAEAAAADRVSQRVTSQIKNLSVMGAPGEASIASGLRYGRAAGDVDAGNEAIQNVGRGFATDMENVRPDPFLSLVSRIGMAAGTAMGGGGIGAQPNIVSPANAADWGSLDAGPAAYDATYTPSIKERLGGALSTFKNSFKQGWGS